ncbi:MAG: polyribonucleotide nucleotidyltransferase [Polyangiaceae bacterium]|nr:polyribonucleotide nucleotidyltransferase [Polyangiaceae bacterium]MCW5791217.1 polyribonucleotide nucleotidyltransferase [Polyangiaceae bacterium]
MIIRESVTVGGKEISFETGRLAKQANGSVLMRLGDCVVLITAVSTSERPHMDFFPLTCEYVEKTYAAGKIPGGFFKREGRLRDNETLTARIMDRPLRPLFPKGYKCDTQIIATVLSADPDNPTDVLALTGASAALHISDIPWAGPVVGIRVAQVAGEFVLYPSFSEIREATIDLVVAVSRDAIVMVEGGADEAAESDIIDALMFAHQGAQPIIDLIERMREAVGQPKRSFKVEALEEAHAARVAQLADADLKQAACIKEKHARYDAYAAVKTRVLATLQEELGEAAYLANEKLLKAEVEHRKAVVVRTMVLKEKVRIDGRDTKTIRPISCEVGLLPRAHGSALFQRGETQAIVTTTLGTRNDEQKIDTLLEDSWKRFMLHYNFPPFSTGETKPLRGPARREIGHGALAERALSRLIPGSDEFPYTIRIVSEVLESNGSSSMASVCGGTLSLMDCGVPLKAPVAGIAMGLIQEGKDVAILSDILGDEDHLGDMDFKVCGTKDGVTAIQMDIKIEGLDRTVLEAALEQAREGRLHILGKMLETLPSVRPEINRWAPRITSIKVKPDQIRIIIGPGGKTIKGIIDQTGCSVNVEDDGTVNVASHDQAAVKRALEIIEGLTAEPEPGKTYKGEVKRIMDFGAFVEIMPGIEGLLHVSEIDYARVERVEDVIQLGDVIEVKLVSLERDGKMRLSRRALMQPPEGWEPPPERERRPRDDSRGGDRGRGRPGGGDRRGPRPPR